eukprot:2498338-Pyramimonas_sp.AAC.1
MLGSPLRRVLSRERLGAMTFALFGRDAFAGEGGDWHYSMAPPRLSSTVAVLAGKVDGDSIV